jgi:DNA-binding CsgD family transcriptional regulator
LFAGSEATVPVSAVIPSLVRWGVSPDADLVYRALVTFGPQTRSQAARELGMSPRRVADALEELSTEDAARVVPSGRGRGAADAGTWYADPPDQVVRALRRRRLRLVDPWERARLHLATIAGLDLPTRPESADNEQVRILRGIEVIRERVADLAAIERYEHLSMNPEQVLHASSVAAAAPLDRALLMRGVRLHTLGVVPADGDASEAHGAELRRLGSLHRVADQLPLKVMTFDRKVAVLPLDLTNMANGALEVSDPTLVQSLVGVILREWKGAQDPYRQNVPAVALTARERNMIELLAAGLTDATVSRRLGMSARTVGYALRGLMDRLQVENRFQLGLALGAQGVYTLRTPSVTGETTPPDPEQSPSHAPPE